MKPLTTILLLAGLAAAAATEDPLPPQAQADVQTLKDAGIRPDDAGLREYLRSLNPSAEVRREIGVLIGELGSEDFAQREAASRRLTALAGMARPELEQASRDKDQEVARRAKDLLAKAAEADHGDEVQLAALREVSRRKTQGIVPLLLETLPRLRRFDLRQAAGRALAATARPEDAEGLRRALGPGDESVCLAAAVVLLDRGDRRALTALGRLLDSEDLPTRNRAGRVLRAVTGRDVGFVAYAAPKVRTQAVARWREWIDQDGPTARLSLPAPAQSPLGKVLLCNWREGHVVELDGSGKKVCEMPYKEARCCQGLPDGNRLLGNSSGQVDEYDARGKHLWHLDAGRHDDEVAAVRRLPSGHTLVLLSREESGEEERLREFRPDTSICWQASLGRDLAVDVQRLGNGNTLVALMGTQRLVEVDRGARVVWQVKARGLPNSVQRLGDGRTLTAFSRGGKVVEVDHGGDVVWSYAINHPTHARRLPDGHTVIATDTKVIEIDAAGRVLWEHQEEGVRYLSAY
jgi:hypothetical protein